MHRDRYRLTKEELLAAIEIVRAQFRHAEWADAAVWKSVMESEIARGDKDLRARLEHMALVQQSFMHSWRGETLDYKLASTFDLETLGRWTRDYHARAATYVAEVAETDLGHEHILPWSHLAGQHFGREMAATTLAETLVQVCLHTAHHRGQVTARLREIGATPPQTDFIIWAWFGKPIADWASLGS
jgi:uncharacterized damage-inducible protein DinB